MHLVHVVKEDYDFYIGREDSRIGELTSPLHNPYKSEGFGGKPWAIELFRSHLVTELKKGRLQRKDLTKMLGKKVGCWCSGNCHGMVLKQFAVDREKDLDSWIRRNSFSTYIVESTDGHLKHKKRLHTLKAFDFGHDAVMYGSSLGKLYPLFRAKASLFGIDWHPHEDYVVDFRHI